MIRQSEYLIGQEILDVTNDFFRARILQPTTQENTYKPKKTRKNGKQITPQKKKYQY